MRTPDCSTRPIVRAQGPEWAVHCDSAWLDQAGPLAAEALPRAGADTGVYRTVLQVLDLGADPIEIMQAPARAASAGRNGGSEPPPGNKPREYPHSSGDRNTFPPRRHPDKSTRGGGTQRVAPTDLPRRPPGTGRQG